MKNGWCFIHVGKSYIITEQQNSGSLEVVKGNLIYNSELIEKTQTNLRKYIESFITWKYNVF